MQSVRRMISLHARLSVLLTVSTLVVAAACFVAPRQARAIPAFAREWQTSCQTCHTAFPDLNPVGEAFRQNGYRFLNVARPDTAPEFIPLGHTTDQVGHEGHVMTHDPGGGFPSETWPGSLPGNFPAALLVFANMSLQQGEPSEGDSAAVAAGAGPGRAVPWQANFGGSAIGLALGGTMGDRISFYGTAELEVGGGVAMDRAALTLSILDVPLLMVTIGALPVSIYPFSIHRSAMGDGLGFTLVTLGDNHWALEPSQLGIEVHGVLANRLFYAAGVVDGQGNNITGSKDVYARMTYKIGGLATDGSGSTGYTRPWQEMSLQLGASVYRGEALMADPAGVDAPHNDWFVRGSVDIDARIENLHLLAAGFIQKNQNPIFGITQSTCLPSAPNCTPQGGLDGAYLEASYMVFPWLMPTVRYMLFNQELPTIDATSGDVTLETQLGHRLLFGVSGLIRENIALRLFAETRKDGDDLFHVSGASMTLVAGF